MSETLARRARAMVSTHGQDATVRTYTFDSSGGYAADDDEKVETSGSPYSTTAIIDSSGSSSPYRDIARTDVEGSFTVFLRDDVSFAGELAGMGESVPASDIEINGRHYRFVGIFEQGNGLLACGAEVKTP